jgi:hypothetical protein
LLLRHYPCVLYYADCGGLLVGLDTVQLALGLHQGDLLLEGVQDLHCLLFLVGLFYGLEDFLAPVAGHIQLERQALVHLFGDLPLAHVLEEVVDRAFRLFLSALVRGLGDDRQELVELDLAALVLVDLVDHPFDLLTALRQAERDQRVLQLFHADAAAAGVVELPEVFAQHGDLLVFEGDIFLEAPLRQPFALLELALEVGHWPPLLLGLGCHHLFAHHPIFI